MPHFQLSLILAIALMMTLPAHAQTPFTGLSAKEVTAMQGGAVIVTEEKQHAGDNEKNVQKTVVARLVVDRPVDAVWSVLANQPLMFSNDPRMKSVKVVQKLGPTEEIVNYKMELGRMLPRFDYNTRVTYRKPSHAIFKRESGSFKDFRSEYFLMPLDGGKKTYVTFSMFVDVGFFIPKFVTRAIIKSDIPAIAQNVRKVVYQKYPKS